jgi:type 2 lantibiotic biosynthesis protein LanM
MVRHPMRPGKLTMYSPSFYDPVWCQAITLTERLALPRNGQRETPDSLTNLDSGMRRLQRWRSQPPFTTEAFFSKRLALDNISETDLLFLLAEPGESLLGRLRHTPSWLKEILLSYSRAEPSGAGSWPPANGSQDNQYNGFFRLIEPLLARSRTRLRKGIGALTATHADLVFDPLAIEEALLTNLRDQLLMLMSRTLVLELNVARLKGQLEGDTPAERFRSFINRLCNPATALSLLSEYPVLARQITLHLRHWLDFSLEFLTRLLNDWSDICRQLSPLAQPGPLLSVQSTAGDRHKQGRAVMAATFESGFRLIYKPKSLAADYHLQRLLEWVNERGAEPQFQTLKVIDRGTYGWSEYVEASACQSPEQVERFYRRQGGYLALLYMLEATDFHYENLIAAGEHPMMIDIESLFHPRLGEAVAARRWEIFASAILNSSVLRVGLLPQRLHFKPSDKGIDLSGLGAGAGQLTPCDLPYWEQNGTDEMHLARKRMTMPAGQNRPSLNGAEVNMLGYGNAIIRGFTDTYRLVLKHSEELLAEDGPLAAFLDDEVRAIVRPTRTYGLLLHDSFHPNLLRNALDRDRFFDRLWSGIESQPYLSRVIHAELHDLQQGDIPIFTTRPGSLDIWTSTGERIPCFLDESGMSLVNQRVRQLSEQDLKRQKWIIRASLASSAIAEKRKPPQRGTARQPPAPIRHEQLIAVASTIGDRLEELAFTDEENISWIGLTFIDDETCSLLPLSYDLYNGTSGVVLSLAYLGHLTGEPRYLRLAQAASRSLTAPLSNLDQHSAASLFNSIGAFDGCGSLIYTLTHLGRLWRQPELLAQAESLIRFLPPLIYKDERFDIMSGAAGLIGALLALFRYRPQLATLQTVILCCEHLLAHTSIQSRGIGWANQPSGGPPLNGFSHGNAGIGWALWRVGRLTGRAEFIEAAEAALSYERSLFCAERGNWPDLREQRGDEAQPEAMMTAWCHGAAGIGLARLQMFKQAESPQQKERLRVEVEVAVETTLREGFGDNHSLCHGDMGNLELLMEAAEVFGNERLRQQAEELLAQVVREIEQEGYRCAVPLKVETPGLMTGLAGIGYGLLRAAAPRRVPSVLSLDAPL